MDDRCGFRADLRRTCRSIGKGGRLPDTTLARRNKSDSANYISKAILQFEEIGMDLAVPE